MSGVKTGRHLGPPLQPKSFEPARRFVRPITSGQTARVGSDLGGAQASVVRRSGNLRCDRSCRGQQARSVEDRRRLRAIDLPEKPCPSASGPDLTGWGRAGGGRGGAAWKLRFLNGSPRPAIWSPRVRGRRASFWGSRRWAARGGGGVEGAGGWDLSIPALAFGAAAPPWCGHAPVSRARGGHLRSGRGGVARPRPFLPPVPGGPGDPFHGPRLHAREVMRVEVGLAPDHALAGAARRLAGGLAPRARPGRRPARTRGCGPSRR